MAQSADNKKYSLIGGFKNAPFIGYVSAPDRTNVTPQAMVMGSKNIYKKISGNLSVRDGLKRRSVADTTMAGTLASYEWNTSLATVRPLRVNNGKLEVESNIVDPDIYLWYTLQSSITEDISAYIFSTLWDNTLKKDFLTFVRHDTNLFRWEGGIGVTASYTSNTIVMTATVASQGFNPTAGSVTVNGTTYTYSGSSGSTLTGVNPDPSGEPAGSVVLSAVITNATVPAATFTNDWVSQVGNRLHVGSYTSRLVYISAQDDYLDYSVPTPRLPGSPELLTLDSLSKGMGVRQGQAHIFGGTSDLYIVAYQAITVGAVLTEQTTVNKKALALLESAIRQEFIDMIGDDLIWLSQNQELKTYGTYRNLNEPVFPTLSLPVKTDLQAEDFTGGALRAVGEFVYLTAPNNGRVWLYQIRTIVNELGNVSKERLWHSPFIWNTSRIAVINDVEYGHSNANPAVYQLWDTGQWHDDGPADTAEGPEIFPYDCVMAMAYRNSGKREQLMNLNNAFYEGYLTPGSTVNAAVVLDYKGASGVLATILNSVESPSVFFQGDVGVSLGDSSLGDNPLGDGLTNDDDIEALPKFRVSATFEPTDVFEYQLRVYSSLPDCRWEILCLGTNAVPSDRIAAAISK